MTGSTAFTDRLNHIHCASCGVCFGMTADMEQRRRNDHRVFYCPNGHTNYYNEKSAEDKLRDEVERERQLRQQAEQRTAYYSDVATAEKRSAAAYKGQLTKTKNRINAGVCPCCNRSFANLARHMASQHKDYAKDNVVVLDQKKGNKNGTKVK